MDQNYIETSVKGKCIRVPALCLDGRTLVLLGRWMKVASIHDEEWLERELDDPKEFIEQLKHKRSRCFSADIFTFTQKMPGTSPKYDLPMEFDSIAVARFGSFKEWWEKLPQETRKNVRRSRKRGVIVKVKEFDANLIRDIVKVNNDSQIRQNKPNYQYGKNVDQVRKDYSSFIDRSEFICACVEDELIGFLKLVYRGDVASILNLTTMLSQTDKRPANALLAKAVELCEARGISHITYGSLNYGNKRHCTLREFKIRNGFEEVLVPRYYVPLTFRGVLWMKLKLHRGLLGILPESIITMGINVRSKWYSLRQSKGRCSSMPERPNRIRQMGCSNPPAGSND
jgi:hypothetical protein